MKTVLTVAVLIGVSTAAGGQTRLADQLRKAVVQEETGKNLEKAAQDYQNIVAQFDADRATAATALFRLAECYRKAGKREGAIAAYERVVREFPDQAVLVKSSRLQLKEAFGKGDALTPVSPEAAQLRRELEAVQKALKAAQSRDVFFERSSGVEPGDKAFTPESARLDIQYAEQRLAQAQKLYEVGTLTQSSVLELQLKLEAAKRRYEQAMEMRTAGVREAQAEIELTQQTLKSVESEIDVVRARISELQKNVAAGSTAQDPELLQLRRDLIQLQLKAEQLKIQLQLKIDQLRLLSKR